MEATFGAYIKRLRLERGQTLRAFCEAHHLDPANYSKLERGKLAAPRDPQKLESYMKALGIDPDGPERREMERLAALSRNEVPPQVLANRELVGKLPAFFRTLEGDPVDNELLDDLIETIRRE